MYCKAVDLKKPPLITLTASFSSPPKHALSLSVFTFIVTSSAHPRELQQGEAVELDIDNDSHLISFLSNPPQSVNRERTKGVMDLSDCSSADDFSILPSTKQHRPG